MKNNNKTTNMVNGNWKCSECSKKITVLPFTPQEDRLNTLKCLDCYKKGNNITQKQNDKKMFEGEWMCSRCGNTIRKLPFEPKSDKNLMCIECFKVSRH